MNKSVSMTIQDNDLSNIVITISGRLDIDATTNIWQQCIEAQSKQPKKLTIQAKDILYCDGAGIALFLALKKRQEELKKIFVIENLNPHFQELLRIVSEPTKAQNETPPDEELSLRTNLGHLTINVAKNIRDNISFLGELSYFTLKALRHPKILRWKDTWRAAEDVGPKAFPIIALIGFLIGLISTFQSARPLGEFGAQIYIINLVGLGLIREMGPLMTAVLLAGRTASSFAAEIGTMKINQEVDALQTMGLNIVKFLTLPRVIATTLMTPFLNIFLVLFGLIGCSIVMHTLGYPIQTFLRQLNSAISIKDIFSGLLKAFVFGIVIASVGCLNGLRTKNDASAVGYSTTQAVVSSLIMIVFVDGLFAIIYYVIKV